MVNFLFICGQVLLLMGCLYGAYRSIAYRGAIKQNQGQKYGSFTLNPEAAELPRWPRDLCYYV